MWDLLWILILLVLIYLFSRRIRDQRKVMYSLKHATSHLRVPVTEYARSAKRKAKRHAKKRK